MNNPEPILVWLTYTSLSQVCGRYRMTRRLVEWIPGTTKLVRFYPLAEKTTIPPEDQLKGRIYQRTGDLIHDEKFMKACRDGGVIPHGVKIT